MAKEPENSRTADHWKRKFYSSLDELEQKEKEWSELERLLRTLASRLSLVADGRDKKLDRQLDNLREALRNEHNAYKLAKIIQEVTTQVSRLETTPAKNDAVDLSLPLSSLLDHINIPKSLERQENYVRKKLTKASDLVAVNDVSKDVAELLSLVIDVIAELRISDKQSHLSQQKISEEGEPQGDVNAPVLQKSTEEKSGLFSGLFSREKDEAVKDMEGITQPPQTPDTDRSQILSLDPNLVATEDPNKDQVVTDEIQTLSLAADTLIRLLERMQLPGDLHIQADLIKRKLEPCDSTDLLANGLEATADLLAELSQRVQSERKALEDFLIQLTKRLQELDIDLRETVKLRDRSHQAGQQINTVVTDEVNQIEQSVNTAADLDSLKTTIQSRVILIRDHMDRFLQGEEGRYADSEKIINKLNNELEQANKEAEALRQQVVEAQQAAMRDQLTGIPNRMSYEQNITAELARYKRYQKPFSIMVWDVDKFKNINDSYGHAAGDKVLTIVAKLLEANVRETDHLARYGGEEFVIILPETSLQQAPPLTEKLRKGIENIEFHFRGKRVVITASCGLAEVKPGEDSIALFKRADAALYRAKENGRNRFELAEN